MSLRYLLLSCFLLPLALAAQTDSVDYRRLQFGISGSASFAEVDFTPNAALITYPGRNYGVALRYFDRQAVGFQAELSYEQTGWREDFGGGSVYERQTDYAEVLILTQLSIGRGAVQPLLQAGPYLSVPVSERELLPPDADIITTSYYGNPLPNRLNYGLRAGLGLNIELGPVTVQLDGRYLQGFSNLFRPGERGVATSIRRAYAGHVALFYAVGKTNR